MAKKWPYRYRLYKHLQENTANIYADVRKAGEALGIVGDIKNNLGLTGAVSGNHGFLPREVEAAMHEVARKVVANATLDEKIRDVVKDFYGDEYDAALVNTCEGALQVSYDVCFTPPLSGRGDGYRGRYVAPLERHLHHQAGYGRPYPPRYKEYMAERGEAAGEFGIHGKRLNSLDTVMVRLPGATYPGHGIKYNAVPQLVHVDAKASVEAIAVAADRHKDSVVGFASLGYDTPGYGYGDRASAKAATLQVGMAKIAQKYDVPYIVDNAFGAPFVGTDIREVGCDLILYSMDKTAGAPTSGLIIGKEEPMVQIRRALGIHGARYGTLSSHGKSAYVTLDPGKESLAGALAALKLLKDRPEVALSATDGLYKIILDEFTALPAVLQKGWIITKSQNCLAVELNYGDQWLNSELGIPIFSIEDMYAGTCLTQTCMSQMGIIPAIMYDANIMISNGLGNMDEEGLLLEKPTRLMIKGMFKVIEILSRYAGLLD
jgi:hypothetical protein